MVLPRAGVGSGRPRGWWPLVVLSVAAVALTGCTSASSAPRPSGSPSASGTAGSSPTAVAPAAASCASLPVRGTVVNQLPAITLRCLGAGGSVTLNHLQPPLVVNLWASWCYPCQQEMPRLQAAYAAQHGRLPFLGVATQDTGKAAGSFAAHVGARYPDVLDSQGLLARQLGAVGLPVTLVLDAQGRIVYRHSGEMFPPDIRQALAAAGVAPASPAASATPKGSPS